MITIDKNDEIIKKNIVVIDKRRRENIKTGKKLNKRQIATCQVCEKQNHEMKVC